MSRRDDATVPSQSRLRTGQCVCGGVPFFVRSGGIGQPGHFHCRFSNLSRRFSGTDVIQAGA